MLARFVSTGTANVKHPLLEVNGDLANTVLAIVANADITFKPCQTSSPGHRALGEQAAVEVDL